MKKLLLFLSVFCASYGYGQKPGLPSSPKNYNIKFSDSSISALYSNLLNIEAIVDGSNLDHQKAKFCIQVLEDLRINIKLQYLQQTAVIDATSKMLDSSSNKKTQQNGKKH